MAVCNYFATASGGCASKLWWFADKIIGIRNVFRNLRTVSVIHIELITGVILTLKSRG
jgi:hypothetical protein